MYYIYTWYIHQQACYLRVAKQVDIVHDEDVLYHNVQN